MTIQKNNQLLELDEDQSKLIKDLKKEKDLLQSELSIVKAIDPERLTNLDSYIIKPNRSLKKECTAITQLGDVHGDEIVSPNITNGLNEYNPDICKQRVERYFIRLIYMIRTLRRSGVRINNLVLHLVGDFISGWIHEELTQTNSSS